MKRRPLIIPVLLSVLVSGCTLVDQRTFQSGPPGLAPPPPVVLLPPPQAPGPTPFATIHAAPGLNLAQALGPAVKAALARKPDVAFTVTAQGPDEAAASAQAALAGQVAATVMAAGIPPLRVRLTGSIRPGAPAEVLLYAH